MEVRLLLRTALAVTLLASLSLAQQESHNECLSRNAKSCGECIQVGSRCAWCTMSNFTGVGESNSARCDYAENLKERKCDERHVESPRGQVHVLRNTPVSDQGTKLPPENITQLAPQHVRLTLRAGAGLRGRREIFVAGERARGELASWRGARDEFARSLVNRKWRAPPPAIGRIAGVLGDGARVGDDA
ncbi:integrin beta-1-A-like [Lampetra planeri]